MEKEAFQILVVDDELLFAEGIEQILSYEGYSVQTVSSGDEALQKLKWKAYHLVITDLMMPGMNGMALLSEVVNNAQTIEGLPTAVILMTAYATIPNAVAAMKEGAAGYYVKGNNPSELLTEVSAVFEAQGVASSKLTARTLNNEDGPVSELVQSQNEQFAKMVSLARKAAMSPVNILLLGESGVGKDVLAQYIHEVSPRCQGPFVAVNCQSLSDQVLESELFGHSKGAFTGALTERVGRFETAHEGTLFLDEVADISLTTQVKLLRVIENKEIERLGSNDTIKTDFRLITATNKDMGALIEKGLFREDFYYRISTIVLEIPPLRKRKEDLPKLVQHFVKQAGESMGKTIHTIEPEVWAYLEQYDFPGNVRELKNIVERLVVFSENGIITSQDLFGYSSHELQISDREVEADVLTLRDFRAAVEKNYISSILEKNQYNMTATSEMLGITRRQLFNKIKALGLDE